MKTCSWWIRGWHRRLRMMDIEFVWREFFEQAETIDTARVAWEVFLAHEGQGHWHCGCGAPIRELFRTTTIQVAE